MAIMAFNPASIFQDPTYLAYRAALGLESDTAAARLRSAQDAARRSAAQQMADIGFQGEGQRQSISNSYEGRGFSRSSGRQLAMARQQAGEGRAYSGIATDTANRIADLEAQIAQSRVGAAREAASAAFSAAPKVQANVEGY